MAEKIKIKENKSWGALNSPRFTLMLETYASEEQQRKSNYDVLSKLIGKNDILLELDSSLLNLPPKQRESYSLKFIEGIRALGVEYKCSKVASSTSPSLFSAILGNKSAPAQQIIAHIPNEIWTKPEMMNLLSLYGARYFVPKEITDGSKMFDDFQKMMDEEKLDYFKLIAFDVITFNSIGVFTSCLSLSELNALLGIV